MAGGDDSGTKEFDPTQQTLQKLRRQGRVPKSTDFAQLATYIAAVMYLIFNAPFMWDQFAKMFVGLWKELSSGYLTEVGAGYIIEYAFKPALMIVMPLFLVVAVAGILANVGQTGPIFSTDSISPKLSNLNPLTRIKQIFSLKGIVDLVKAIFKVIVLGYIAYVVTTDHWEQIIAAISTSTYRNIWVIFKEVIYDFVIKTSIALLVIALADLLYQRFQFTKDNRLTMKQLRDEMKESDGDPMVKAQRRQLARQMAQRRQQSDIPTADFIATNPTKIAVAIRYVSGAMEAPRVVAKGGDASAWKIIALGKAHGVPIIENIPLARALYKLVKVGSFVPPELFRAVAEVLIFAYQIRAKSRASSPVA